MRRHLEQSAVISALAAATVPAQDITACVRTEPDDERRQWRGDVVVTFGAPKP